jgi:2-dehydropantoate 2-reductase
MRFHVIGLGSIGTLFAHHLRRVVPVKHGVTLLKRTPLDARKAEETGGKISVEFGGITMPRDGFIYDSGPRVADPTLSLAGKQKRFMEYRESLLRRKRDGDYIESLIVSTKAGSTLEALKALRPRLDAHSTIVLLQNGMGVYEHLTREVFPQPSTRPHFILTANTHGAWLKNPGHVVHAGFGRVDFGIVPDPRRGRDFEALFHTYATHPERLNALVDGDNMGTYVGLRNTISALLALDLNVHWQPISDVETTMRRKLVTNAVINPLTAILRCNNGGLLSNENATRIRDAVCHEASAVFAAQLRAETQRKLSTPPQTPELESESAWANGQFDMVDQEDFDSGYDSDDVPSSFPPPLSDAFASQPWHSTLLPAALRPEALIKECQRITTITRNNVSSMLRDVRRGAPTEIDYINGYLLSLGAAYRIPMPVTGTLYRMVKLRSTLPETEPI